MKTTIDHAGRLVIPKDIRRESGIKPEMRLEVRWEKGASNCYHSGARIVQLHRDIDRDELQRLKSLDPNLTVIKSLVIGMNESATRVPSISSSTLADRI
jgi:AbrB family looped-hinge helix DNA binding protein